MILMVGAEDVDTVQSRLAAAGESSYVVGEVVTGSKEVSF